MSKTFVRYQVPKELVNCTLVAMLRPLTGDFQVFNAFHSALFPTWKVRLPPGVLLGVPNELRPISRIGWRGADPFGAPYHWRQVKTLPSLNVSAPQVYAVVHGCCPELKFPHWCSNQIVPVRRRVLPPMVTVPLLCEIGPV